MFQANIEIELYEENGKRYVYLSNDGSSGCKYEIVDNKSLQEIVANYVADIYTDLIGG